MTRMIRGRVLAGLCAGLLTIGVGRTWAFGTGATGMTCTNGACQLTTPVAVGNGGTGLSSSPDDNIMIGNGTVWQSKSVPTCTDTGGNHLNYDASTNTLSCGTSSGATIPPVLGFGTFTPISTSQTVYLGFGTGVDTTEGVVQLPSPGATYKNLRCVNNAIQGASNNITITARVGACGSQADGLMTCTITGTTGANQACSDTTNTAAPTAAQCIDFKVVTPASLTANAQVACTVERTA